MILKNLVLSLIISWLFLVNQNNLISTESSVILFILATLVISINSTTFNQVLVLVIIILLLYNFNIFKQYNKQLPTILNKRFEIITTLKINKVINQSNRTKIYAHILTAKLPTNNTTIDLPIKKVQLSWYYNNHELTENSIWQLKIRLSPPVGVNNFSSFNYQKWLFVNEIGATGYVVNSQFNKLIRKSDQFIFNQITQLITNRLLLATDGLNQQNFILAMALGKKNFSQTEWQTFNKLGITHLIIISGLHLSLIALLIFSLAKLLLIRIKPNARLNIAMLISFLFCLSYALISGLAVSSIRAIVMIGFIYCVILFKRNVNKYSGLYLAFLLMVGLQPMIFFKLGFWLSFSISFLLINLYLNNDVKLKNFFTSQFKIFFFITPILLFNSGSVSIISPILNLILIPLVSFILLPVILITTIISQFSLSFASEIFSLVNYCWDLIFKLLQIVELWQFTNLDLQINFWQFLVAELFVIILVFDLPKNYLLPILLLPFFFNNTVLQQNLLKNGEFRLVSFDVGNANSQLIATKKHTILFDVGFKSQNFNQALDVILPFLKANNINELNKLIISSSDKDHSGGYKELIKNFPIKSVITNFNEFSCKRGENFTFDGVYFEFINPPRLNYFTKKNNNSCALMIKGKFGSVLLTGDIEKLAERKILNYYSKDFLKSDLIIAPHHGSITSSTKPFINAVKPKYVIFSVGYLNRYRHPNQIILVRYLLNHIKPLISYQNGTIIFSFLSNGINYQSYKDLNNEIFINPNLNIVN